jgi:hypothetical protein
MKFCERCVIRRVLHISALILLGVPTGHAEAQAPHGAVSDVVVRVVDAFGQTIEPEKVKLEIKSEDGSFDRKPKPGESISLPRLLSLSNRLYIVDVFSEGYMPVRRQYFPRSAKEILVIGMQHDPGDVPIAGRSLQIRVRRDLQSPALEATLSFPFLNWSQTVPVVNGDHVEFRGVPDGRCDLIVRNRSDETGRFLLEVDFPGRSELAWDMNEAVLPKGLRVVRVPTSRSPQ